ncbi:MAG TPA: glycoside hydrolase family 28 protein [Terracidiphilus sp.]|nr:glycoside hydrolase family 28 protein [Terracidiphilus sp.]
MTRSKESLGRRVFTLATATILMATSAAALHAAAVCNVRGYGAKGDGTTKDTAAIQKAIDACEEKGGGTVTLPAGNYLSAPIVLKSNITFHLDKGATLLGSTDHSDYAAITEFRAPGLQSLVSAKDASNIKIDGEGTINGQGESWWEEARHTPGSGILGSHHPRPRLVVFDHCRHIVIEGVTIENSPMWQVVPYYSDDVTIRNVRILAPTPSPNTDAMDPFSSSNVLIEHVYADVGDDNVAIKSGMINSPGPDSPSRNITVRNCVFMHGHGMSIGSELAGGAQNIIAEHIQFNGTDQGVRVKANRDRGNVVKNLVFRDLTMKDVKNAIVISEYYPRIMPTGGVEPAPVGRLTPHFSDITIENVTATGSKSAGAIVGLPESPVKNVVLKNVKISAQKGLTIGYADVTGSDVVVQAAEGEGITKLAGAKVVLTNSHP